VRTRAIGAQADSTVMIMKLKTCQNRGTLVLDLPASQVGWQSGDELTADVDAETGRITLVRTQTREEQLEAIVEKMFEEYDETFKALAKS
jgi:hypothetical protein